jgi:hypothetical protein
VADAGVDGADGVLGSLLSVFNLRRAPVTVVFSCLSLFGWILSSLAVANVMPLLAFMPHWLAGLITLIAVLLVAVPLTSLATKPFERVFRQTEGKRRLDFVGTVCRISTGTVDEKHGQATVDDGGAGLIIQVRAEANFKRGDRAIIVDYDREREAYIVEAYEELLQEEAERRDRHTST